MTVIEMIEDINKIINLYGDLEFVHGCRYDYQTCSIYENDGSTRLSQLLNELEPGYTYTNTEVVFNEMNRDYDIESIVVDENGYVKFEY